VNSKGAQYERAKILLKKFLLYRIAVISLTAEITVLVIALIVGGK
jgi:hypothetical protein